MGAGHELGSFWHKSTEDESSVHEVTESRIRLGFRVSGRADNARDACGDKLRL